MALDITTITEDFSFLDDWEDKYRYVIELGRELGTFPESERTDANKISGCVSQVWLVTQTGSGADPVLTFMGDSDAHIVRGLVAIMIAAVSGKHASQVAAFDSEAFLLSLGLDSHLTPQRANGLRSLIRRMKNDAAAALAPA